MKDYKKMLRGVVNIINTTEKSDIGFTNICTYISENCPELKESEDERIRKEIIGLEYISKATGCKEWIAWLKKQGETSPILSNSSNIGKNTWSEDGDKIEPRFKVGDWVVANYSCKVSQVVAVSEDGYGYQLNDGLCFGVSWCDIFHLWCIKDARDGDVLVHNSCVFIFMGLKDGIVQAINEFFPKPTNFGDPDIDDDYHPATKEQHDLLFQKMEEAGYKWDSENKTVITIK